MIYPIVMYGDPVLKRRAREIEEGELDVKAFAESMFETMENANGVGLAAPQVGKGLRLFVVDTTQLEDETVPEFKQVFVNPSLIEENGDEWGFEEGCLSIPNIREDVTRKAKIRLRYFDENWNQHETEFDGMPARIIQHEYDHLEGVLFTDHLTPLKRRLLKGKLGNISKGKVDVSYAIAIPKTKVKV